MLLGLAGIGFATATAASAGVPNRMTIAAVPRLVVYGGAVSLSGTVSPAHAGESVVIAAQPGGSATFSVTASVRTDAAGAWRSSVRPALATKYRASRNGTLSGAVAVAVRPRVSLRRLSTGRFFVAAVAARSFGGRAVLLQRRSGTHWETIARSTFDETATARLRVLLPRGRSIVRAYIPRAVTGYAEGRSAPLTVQA